MDEVCKQSCFHPATVETVRERLAEDERQAPDAAAWFKTLGSPRRLTILRALRHGELCVCDIAVLLGLSTGATSQQLKQLRDQGWLSMRNDGRMVYYRLHEGAPFARLEVELARLAAESLPPTLEGSA
ncbi:MAG TPA: metalloregulator ArsR/SmtB family transcription factor [Gammaproteobacteria bacterium]|nr:metalloregulator ArsR/SmtB family transcription factor [Gammaproteobacteria bacterium]